jgi:RND family efflux transporter MFP subunit
MKLYDSRPDPADLPPPPPAPVEAGAGQPAGPGLARGTIAYAGAIVLGVIAVAIAVVNMGHAPAAVEPPPPAGPAMTVTLAAVARANWDATLDASGAIEPWQEAVLGAQGAGLRLLEVRANVGDTVRRGQVLARFDAAALRAGLAELQAGLLRAEAEARQAATNRQRMQTLKGSGGISEQEVLQYETQADTSAAQVAVVRAQVESRRVQLDYAELRAPDDGIISARGATVGAVADSGAELFRLIRQGRLEWRGELTAAQLARIAPGQRVVLRLPDGSAASARVRQSAPRLDAESRMATVYADIDTGSGARAGMYAAGKVVLQQRQALIVPAASVVIRDGRSYVFKVGADAAQPLAAARAVHVEVGRRQGDAVELLGSVAVGERVVVQGAGFLKDGDTVRVISTSPGARPGATADAAAPVATKG